MTRVLLLSCANSPTPPSLSGLYKYTVPVSAGRSCFLCGLLRLLQMTNQLRSLSPFRSFTHTFGGVRILPARRLSTKSSINLFAPPPPPLTSSSTRAPFKCSVLACVLNAARLNFSLHKRRQVPSPRGAHCSSIRPYCFFKVAAVSGSRPCWGASRLLAAEGLVELDGKKVTAVPLAEFVEALHARPEFL